MSFATLLCLLRYVFTILYLSVHCLHYPLLMWGNFFTIIYWCDVYFLHNPLLMWRTLSSLPITYVTHTFTFTYLCDARCCYNSLLMGLDYKQSGMLKNEYLDLTSRLSVEHRVADATFWRDGLLLGFTLVLTLNRISSQKYPDFWMEPSLPRDFSKSVCLSVSDLISGVELLPFSLFAFSLPL